MKSPQLKRCAVCLLPETHEAIDFNNNGVCSVCRNHDIKSKINWEDRFAQLNSIIDQHKGKKQYDCIIPFSGGKDSTFTLYYVVEILKLKPLVVCFDHGFMRSTVIENRTRTLRKLGVDFLSFTPNWKLVRELMLQSFLDKGDFCWHCHTGIFSYPMWIAIEKQIPLIFWGEPSSEYTSFYNYGEIEEVNQNRFNLITNLGINAEDMFFRLDEKFSMRDLQVFSYPSINKLRELGVVSVPLGSFIPWDVKKQFEIIQSELEWKGESVEGVPPEYNYEKIECYMQGVRDYIKYLKRGYARTTHLTSIDIRNGRLTKQEAETLVAEFEGQKPHALELFLEYTGLTESEFLEIALSHKVTNFDNKVMVNILPKPNDFDSWPRGQGIARDETLEKYQKWKNSYGE